MNKPPLSSINTKVYKNSIYLKTINPFKVRLRFAPNNVNQGVNEPFEKEAYQHENYELKWCPRSA